MASFLHIPRCVSTAFLVLAVSVELLPRPMASPQQPSEKSLLLAWKSVALADTPSDTVAAEKLTRWNESSDPCSDNWPGIYCGSGRVVRIALESHGLQGTLPTSWSLLKGLRQVSLKNNRLTGPPLPSEWTALSALTLLDVGSNLLDAELPYDMGIFSKLEYLYAVDNLVPGALPQNLGNLKYISLEDNFLAGGLPEWSDSPVVSLALSGNLLGGRIPPTWSTLSSLKFLDLDDNQLTGELPAAVLNNVLSRLETLSLQDNFFAAASLSELSNVSSEDSRWTLLPQKERPIEEPATPAAVSSRLFSAGDGSAGTAKGDDETDLPQWAIIVISAFVSTALPASFVGFVLYRIRRKKRSPTDVDCDQNKGGDTPPVARNSPPQSLVELYQQPPLPDKALTDVRFAPNPGDEALHHQLPPMNIRSSIKHTDNELRYLRPPSATLLVPEAFVDPPVYSPFDKRDDSAQALLAESDDVCDESQMNDDDALISCSTPVPVRILSPDESSSPSSSSFSTPHTSRTSSFRRASSTAADDYCAPLISNKPSSSRRHQPSSSHHRPTANEELELASRASSTTPRLPSMLAATEGISSSSPRQHWRRPAHFLAEQCFDSDEPFDIPNNNGGLPGAAPDDTSLPPLPPLRPAFDSSLASSSDSTPPTAWAFRQMGANNVMLASPSGRVASSSSLTPLRSSRSAQNSRSINAAGATGGLLGRLRPMEEELSPPKRSGSAPCGQEGVRNASVSRGTHPAMVVSASASAAAAYRAPLRSGYSPSSSASSSKRKLSAMPTALLAQQFRRSLSRNE